MGILTVLRRNRRFCQQEYVFLRIRIIRLDQWPISTLLSVEIPILTKPFIQEQSSKLFNSGNFNLMKQEQVFQ